MKKNKFGMLLRPLAALPVLLPLTFVSDGYPRGIRKSEGREVI